MTNRVNILHLSDLHFGAEPTDKVTSTAIAQRKNVLDGLLKTLGKLDSDWKPNIIVISGDIGWKGVKKDYKQAKDWLETLLNTLNLTPNEFVVCAGNHDIDRNATIGMLPPNSASMADEWLAIENLENFIRPFQAYKLFCEGFAIPQLLLGEQSFYLIGQRELAGLRFVVLNSSWFCRGDKDKGKLWIGLPQLKIMRAHSQLVEPDNYDTDTITIAVFHHPFSWLNDEEQNTYSSRPETCQYLSKSCHIILSGHVHSAAIKQSDRIRSHAHLFSGGATYTGDNYRNNCSILQIDINNRSVMRQAFVFDPCVGNWEARIDDISCPLRVENISSQKQISVTDESYKTSCDYPSLIQKAKEHAIRYVERKSRAIARTEQLPNLFERKVAVHNKEERVNTFQNETLQLNTKDNLASLEEMVSVEQPTFLFGELGSGKSTLVGMYVARLAEGDERLIPILVPAGFFLNKKIDTVAKFSAQVSEYVNEQITPAQNDFDLDAALKSKQEITLVIDGFDELDRETARTVLLRTEELISHWSGLRVIATGRPIELQGLNYNRWQCLEMVPLTNEERKLLLINEALADELDEQKAEIDAESRVRFLNSMPELLSVATTPLAVRLMRPHLKQSAGKKSLGDLLYDILLERLGEWGAKDAKEVSIKEFKQVFPDALSREKILGEIAAKIYNSPGKFITIEALHTILESEIEGIPNRNTVVSQGCDFFQKNLLQESNGILTFPAQPLFQCALGCYIATKFRLQETLLLAEELNYLWREYSFAAAVARRKNIIQELRPQFQTYIADLLTKEDMSPAAAMIISESEDSELARDFIRSLHQFHFRPLRYFQDIETQCTVAFANCFYLAGEEGFNWFYEEYLNPIYPLGVYSNRDIHASILQHWLLLSDFKLTPEQRAKLSKIPEPHIVGRSWQCHALLPTIALVLPDLFNPKQRALLYASSLTSNLFQEKVCQLLKKEFETGNQDTALNALETVCAKNEGSTIIAAKLWLELSQEKPPLSIIHSIITAARAGENQQLYKVLEHRIGTDNLKNTLRWYVFQESKLAASAALLLYRQGEHNLFLLGNGLLKGVFYGKEFEGAEEVLQELIHNNGIRGLKWLVRQFSSSDTGYGPPPAYWRILLSELCNVDTLQANMFWFAILYLGVHTLPRYPEIRRKFRTLLTSKPNYKGLTEEALRDLDNVRRFNAACILLTCFPETETLAAEIVINATSTSFTFHRQEWNRFCLRLSLGKKALNHIAAKLDSFLPVSKTFALALLYHNDYSLSEAQYKELIHGLLGKASGFDHPGFSDDDESHRILAQDEAFEPLIEHLDGQNNELAKEAADSLWRYHRSKLTPFQYAKCWLLVVDDLNYWNLQRLDDEFKRLIQDTEFTEHVKLVSQEAQPQKGEEPLANIYLRTFSDISAWKDLIWKGMFSKWADHVQVEQSFMWLFNRGRKNPTIGQVIGSAATEFLEHPSVTTERMYNDLVPWLTFLAHEFNRLSAIKVEHTILKYQPIGQDIISALIARLGDVPQNYKPRENREYLTLFVHNYRVNVVSPQFEQIVEVTRDSEEIHNYFGLWIESTLLSGALSDKDLQLLALKSRFGTLFSMIISFCRRTLNNYDWVVRTIDLGFSRQQQNQHAKIIARASHIIRRIIAEDSQKREQYFECIEKAIENKSHPDIIKLYRELLIYRKPIKSSLLPNLLTELSSLPHYLDFELTCMLTDYFLAIQETQKPFILSELKKIISALNSECEEFTSGNTRFYEWLFPLAVFYLQGNIDEESERVFLHALQSAFIDPYGTRRQHHNRENSFHAGDILNSIYPLLKKIPPELIRQCIEKGANSDIPEVRSCCRILLALTRK